MTKSAIDFVNSCAKLTEYVSGKHIESRFDGLTISVIEFNELLEAAKEYDKCGNL